MTNRTLKNAPLIEAIFELKWQPQQTKDIPGLDPHYNLLPGQLYERLKDKYPTHESLPTALVPGEMVQGLVQHRLRTAKDQWPLIQIGPGVFTVNQTTNYTWQDFEQRVIEGVNTLIEIQPAIKSQVNGIMLRYINGIEFDFDNDNALQFLKQEMKVNISLPEQLFQKSDINGEPLAVDCNFTYKCAKPNGIIVLKFARGKRQNSDALIWEMILRTSTTDTPELPALLPQWLNEAHNIIEDWFFGLIMGSLEKRFA